MLSKRRYFLILFVFVFLLNIMVVSATDINEMQNNNVSSLIQDVPVAVDSDLVSYTEDLNPVVFDEDEYYSNIYHDENIVIAQYNDTISTNRLNINQLIYSTDKIDTIIVDSGNSLNQGGEYSVTLKTTDNAPLASKTIQFTIESNNIKTYDVITDENGIAKIALNYPKGAYVLTYTFAGDEEYNYCKNIVKLLIYNDLYTNTSLNIVSSNIYNSEFLKLQLKSSNGNPIYNESIILLLNSTDGVETRYKLTTDQLGEVYQQINTDGVYKAYYSFSGSNVYNPISKEETITVFPRSTTPTSVIISTGDSIFQGKYLIVRVNTSKYNTLSGQSVLITLSKGGASVSYTVLMQVVMQFYR